MAIPLHSTPFTLAVLLGSKLTYMQPIIKYTNNKQCGYLLLEALLAVVIIGLAFTTLLAIGTLSIKTSTSIEQNDQANFLLKEAMESVRSFRDGTTWATNGLGTLSTGSANPYYLVIQSNTWTPTTGTETIGSFTRKIVFDKVSRDTSTSNMESVYNATHDDPNTRKVTVTIVSPSQTLNLITYFTNWK